MYIENRKYILYGWSNLRGTNRAEGEHHPFLQGLLIFVFVLLSTVGGFKESKAADTLPEQNLARGIRSEDVTLWPALFLEGRYDSNIYRKALGEGALVDAFYLRIRPGLAVKNRQTENLALHFRAMGDFRRYFASPGTLNEQSRFGGMANLTADFFPKSVFKFTVSDIFRRELESSDLSNPSALLSFVQNEATARMAIRPGGTIERRPLSFVLGGTYRVTRHSEGYYSRLDTDELETFFKAVWLFYPKTALVGDVRYGLHTFPDKSLVSSVPGLTNFDSTPLYATLGLDGLITSKLGFVINGGYGASWHESGASYSGPVWEAKLLFSPATNLVWRVGNRHTFELSYIGNFYNSNETYLEMETRFANRFDIIASGRYVRVAFGAFDPGASQYIVSTTNRVDNVFGANIKTSFHVYRVLGITLGYDFERVSSNYQVLNTSCSNEICTDFAAYIRHIVYGSFNLQY